MTANPTYAPTWNHALVDVSIVNPTAPSHVSQSSRTLLATANTTAARKEQKYKAMAAAKKMTVVPFILEAYGGMHKQASTFLTALVKQAQQYSGDQLPTKMISLATSAISAAVHRGNANIILRGRISD